MIKSFLKRLRTTQPLNAVATASARGILRHSGIRSELIVKHLHRVGSVECVLPNGRTLLLESDGDDWIPNQIYWRGWSGYEPETLPLFFRLAATARVTLDVGAYLGLFALLAGHANERGKVFAFEPLPNMFGRLERHVELNRLENVACVNSAVSDFDGSTEIFHQSGNTCTASLSREFMQWQTDWKTSTVPVTTVDQFVADKNLRGVDLLKIDTESTEPQVLGGMTHVLENDKPHIVCEVLPSFGVEKHLTEILKPRGYHFYHLTTEGLIRREEIIGDLGHKNYLFTTIGPESVAAL